MSEIIPFNFKGNPVRVVVIDGNPWFVAADLCQALELKRVDSSTRRLRVAEKGTHPMSTPGGQQDFTIVSEPGMWRLVLRSDTPAAIAVQDFVCAEVLPSIRKTGQFGATVNMDAISEAIDRRVNEMVERHVGSRLKLMESKLADFDLWPLADYARSKKVIMTPKEARLIGVSLMAICRANGLRAGQQPAPIRFNTPLRTYPKSVLDAHFESLVTRYRPSPQALLFPAEAIQGKTK